MQIIIDTGAAPPSRADMTKCCDSPQPETGTISYHGDERRCDLYCRACNTSYGVVTWRQPL